MERMEERSRAGPNLKVLTRYLSGGTEKKPVKMAGRGVLSCDLPNAKPTLALSMFIIVNRS